MLRLVTVFALIFAACDATTAAPDLGDPYQVQSRPEPTLVDGELVVAVSYGGGCEAHTFDLDYDERPDRADLWLTHDANGDTCEALITETLTVPVPEAIRTKALRLYVSETATVEVQAGVAP